MNNHNTISPALYLACLRFIFDSQRQPTAPALTSEDVRAIVQEEIESALSPQFDPMELECNRETIEALRALGGRARVKALADHLNIPRTTIQKRLIRMERYGVVCRVNYGVYTIEG